ncbi:MAG: trypsin-like serine protease [Leptolyngbyaceae cyanobacterium CRU_2_3]|nr:trypsin-like serine protease [Leptolyngbyaceae cyanobacterium CRU_2_3]
MFRPADECHVVEDNPTPTIHLRDSQQNEQQFPGRVIAEDHSVDLALIQLSGATGLSVAPLADSSTQVQVGDRVYALGSPVGFHWKLTQSQVIAVQSQCGVFGLKCIRMPKGFLHPGNSGGPLLDQTGQVIGINRALQSTTGEGVSIPIETVKDFLRRQGQLPN